mgnify:CR=1 FL=1
MRDFKICRDRPSCPPRHGLLVDGALGSGNGLVHAFFRAGNDRLAGAVEVDGLDRAALSRNLSTDVFDLIFSQAEDSGHAAFTEGYSFLHELAAEADRADGVSKGQGAGSDEGRIFAETVAGSDVRCQSFLGEDAAAGRAGRQDSRLCIIGLHEFFIGTFKAELGQGETQSVVGFFKKLFGG